MKIILEGLPLTGKTTRLVDEYKELVQSGTRTGDILVLVMNASQLKRWRKALELPVTGSLQVFTYWGFLQKEINRYWHWILPHLGEGEPVLKPLFLNVEAAHYLMTLLVEEHRLNGSFAAIVATSSQIALQVLNNLNQAAINGLTIEDAVRRLVAACGGDRIKSQAFDELLPVAQTFREQCLFYRALDYSLLVDVYNNYLFPQERYQESLQERYKSLIVDNLEEAIPMETKLIAFLLDSVEDAWIAFDPLGGHSRAFGADPELARSTVYPLCQVERLEHFYGCSQEAAELAEVLEENIRELKREQLPSQVIDPVVVSTDFRADMISRVGEAVIELLQAGHHPNSIAVIAPFVDKVLELSLSQQLGAAGYSVQNIADRKYLSDESCAQVMVSIAALIQPETGWTCSKMSLACCFGIVLQLDPIRSSLLARSCLRGGTPELIDLDEAGLRPRIGFNKGQEYDDFKAKIKRIAEDKNEPDRLFQRIFSEILAPVIEEEQDIITSRQVIDSAIKFYQAYQRLPLFQKQPFVKRFLGLLTKGTVAAEALYQEEIQKDAVLLATPFALFRNSLSIQHQFWLDCSDHRWFVKDYKELSNPLIMSKDWDGVWDTAVALEHRRYRASRTLAGLLYRCSGTVKIVESEYSSLGHAQESALPEIILNSVVSSR
jgi:hypothetical protein